MQISNTQNALVLLILTLLSKWRSFFTVSDRAFVSLLGALKVFLQVVGTLLHVDTIRHLARHFPTSMYLFRKHLGFSKDDFIKYIVCPKCNSVYSLDEAVKTVNDVHGKTIRRLSNTCYHVAYPNHPQKKFRQKCGTVLMKSVVGKGGKEHLCPKKMYCYRSLVQSIKDLRMRPGFTEKCEKWRYRTVLEGTYADVYDGQVWKDFNTVSGQPFLQIPGNLGLMLNVDWFQPYKNIQDSVGVIYLTVMNLPREERCKYSNIIVAGIIPGPNEPTHHINGFLEPLVADLQMLWDGVHCTDKDGRQHSIRAALMCISSDIPAARKVAGFLGHFATKGCSKCTKSFPRTEENKADFSGFEDDWPLRNNTEHCQFAKRAKMAKNKAERARIESMYGARYSCLHDLPYLDVVRMHIIDPMHNLLEGTAKRVMQAWKELGVLSKDNFEVLQEKVNSLKL
ncbi:hypothetical protein ACEWY4_017292 [Coilia grayii]|uniref:Transposase n=1 Tax=Coilia grayii TaxID=363190 RepID=A0ABD1JGG1_9TELE